MYFREDILKGAYALVMDEKQPQEVRFAILQVLCLEAHSSGQARGMQEGVEQLGKHIANLDRNRQV